MYHDSAHEKDASVCYLLLRHKNETIPHIIDIQNRLLRIAQSCPTKKVLRKGPRERKTVPQLHFEVAVYQSYCKRTIPLYHALVMREERWITQLFQELFNTQQR